MTISANRVANSILQIRKQIQLSKPIVRAIFAGRNFKLETSISLRFFFFWHYGKRKTRLTLVSYLLTCMSSEHKDQKQMGSG